MTTECLPFPVRAPRAVLQEANAPRVQSRATARCSTCPIRSLCLPRDMAGADIERLDRLTITRRRVPAGHTLYRQDDRFQFIYAVRQGTLRTSLMLADGREQVGGFHLAGELVGLDGVADGRHASTATALEDTEICAIDYSQLGELGGGAGDAEDVISRLMCREIVRESRLMMLLGRAYADQRLAAFLLNLSHRYAVRRGSPREFHLPMSRGEIGSYLGMKLETVSRAFSAFQQQGLLQVSNRNVRILDFEGLRRLLQVRVL